MDDSSLHQLTAAYALDALDGDDAATYREHLRTCEQCRDELSTLTDAAAMLAYGAPSAAPPAQLRERILTTARAERGNVVPLRPRWAVPAAAAAAVAVAASVALAIWAVSLTRSLDHQRTVAAANHTVAQILADPDARRVQLSGAQGTVVVTHAGDAALVVSGLEHARRGSTYEAWVIQGGIPKPAGTFDGGAPTTLVRLRERVDSGVKVAVTVEPGSGSKAPTTQPIFEAQV
jgi:uncharacterized protein YjlB